MSRPVLDKTFVDFLRRGRLLSHIALVWLMVGKLFAADAKPTLDQIVEGWRWQNYWLDRDDSRSLGVPGTTLRVVLFWSKDDLNSLVGLCAGGPRLCIAYAGFAITGRMQFEEELSGIDAVRRFGQGGFGGIVPKRNVRTKLTVEDLEIVEQLITLPVLNDSFVAQKRSPTNEALAQVEVLTKQIVCGLKTKIRNKGCHGTLIFSYYAPSDPYWFVLRSCSAGCSSKGETVLGLTRGPFERWVATIGGYVAEPSSVRRLKARILGAEMVRRNMIP